MTNILIKRSTEYWIGIPQKEMMEKMFCLKFDFFVVPFFVFCSQPVNKKIKKCNITSCIVVVKKTHFLLDSTSFINTNSLNLHKVI